LHVLSPEEMLELHNQYIRASLENLQEHPSEHAAQTLHKWFELEMRSKNLPIGAETIAYLLKASFQTPPGLRRTRLIMRYMDMVPGEAGLEVLGTGILSDEELAYITKVSPTYNFPIGEAELFEEFEQSYTTTLTTDLVPEAPLTAEPKIIPEVLAVKQKGLGLKSLKQALSLFVDTPAAAEAGELTHEQRRERQAQLEQDSIQAAIDRWREESQLLTQMGMDNSLRTKSVGARMWRWHSTLEEYLQAELVKVSEAESREHKTQKDNERCMYGPFLRLLPVDKLAAVTILTVMSSLSTAGADKGMTLSHAIMALGASVEEESITESIRKSHSKEYWEKLNGGKQNLLAKRLRNQSVRQEIVDGLTQLTGKKDPQWSAGIRGRIGAFLMSALLDTAKVPVTREHPETKEKATQMQPAFSHAYQYKFGKKTGVILANPALIEALRREPVHSLLAKHLPMVVEPEPWSKFNKGGFIMHPAKMMRIKLGDKDQRNYAEAAILRGDMEQMFKGLDVLGRTSWKINQPVFDTMLEAWNSGVAIANFPAVDPKLDLPAEPESSTDPSERQKWIRAVKDIENLRGGYHSQRCFQNFQLEIARALREETFFFPHNVDFRGRAYPIPPYLNHMGADHCRGLLAFGQGKELGKNGLRWLKIHLANVYGYDKASLHEREVFADQNVEKIYDSATDPLGGNRWWLKAEDPWQCLAACFELKAALESGDPTKFVSHLPIHQDGTCNGLQHYAALGGDEWGAKQVNLEPGDRPADVYSAVADLVKDLLRKDLEQGNPFAKVLDGKITRKVVKQTVMTNVYGVTFVGAKAQVRKQLVAAYPDLPNEPNMHAGLLSSYIATKIFKALSTMFSGAHDIQYWLGECASRISQAVTPEQLDRLEYELAHSEKSTKKKAKKADTFNVDEHLQFKSSVIWTNPLRMPIVQPYRQSKSKVISTNLQRISISEPHRSDPVSKRKQLSGFPPNFVHSLDATHMILSALQCDELGLSFAAVHDSFWTHAADIEKMNNVLRDAFIRIHSEDVIGRLAAEFRARYKDCIYLTKIKAGSKLYEKLSEWRKQNRGAKGVDETVEGAASAVRKSRIRELLLERRRMRLLASSDPKEVAEGKKMVTPGSIYESMSADADLAMSEDLGAIGLGEISPSEAAHDDIAEADVDSHHMDAHHDEDMHHAEPAANKFAEKLTGKKRSAKSAPTWQWAWLPMSFPAVPKKGNFDVTRLRNSQYFFS
jgi:DNA-directed RNA polymerase